MIKIINLPRFVTISVDVEKNVHGSFCMRFRKRMIISLERESLLCLRDLVQLTISVDVQNACGSFCMRIRERTIISLERVTIMLERSFFLAKG